MPETTPSPARRLPCASLAGLVLLGALVLGGCGEDEITIVVCGDLTVPDQLDALRVELFEADLETRIRDGVLRLATDESGTAMSLSLPIATSLTRPTGPGWVRVEPLLDGVAVGRFDREIFEFDDAKSVDAVLEESCLRGIGCAPGQTCLDGACAPAPTMDDPPGCDP